MSSRMNVVGNPRSAAELARSNRALRMLGYANRSLIRASDEDTLLRDLCRIAVEVGGYRTVWVGFSDGDGDRAAEVRPAAHAGEGLCLARQGTPRTGEPWRTGAVATAMRTREACVVREPCASECLLARRAAAVPGECAAVIALPLLREGEVLGVLELHSCEPDSFDSDETAILAELADDLAYGVTALRTRAERDCILAALQESNRQLEAAERIAHFGHWQRDLASLRATPPEGVLPLFRGGAAALAEGEGGLDRLAEGEVVHPEDRRAVAQALGDAAAGRGACDVQYRVLQPDGRVRYLHSRAEVELDEHGRPRRVFGVTQDVSTQKRTEAALRDAERQLRTLFDNLPDFIARFDREGRHLYINPATLRAVGKSLEQMVGRTPLELGAPEDRAMNLELMAALQRTVAQAEPSVLEIAFHGGTHRHHAEVRFVPELDDDGQIASVIGISRDITARKATEESLRRAEHEVHTLLENFPDLLSRFDREGRFAYVSPAVARVMEVVPESLIGRTPLELGVGADRATSAAIQESLARVIASGEREQLELELASPIGPRRYEIRHLPETDEGGQVIGVIGAARDVTAERATERQAFLLNYALERVKEAIFLVRIDTAAFAYVNRSAADMLGYTVAELTGGMKIFDVDPEWNAERWASILPSLRAGNRPTLQSTQRRRDGSTFPVEVTPNYFEIDGEAYNMAIVRDISERKAAEAALRASETTYRSLVTAMAEAAVFLDQDGRITAVNPAAERILGRPAAALLGQTAAVPFETIHEDGTPFPVDTHPSMITLRTGAPQNNVVMGVRAPDESLKWISINSQPLVAPGVARPYAVVTTFHDITDRRRAEAEARERERQYRTLAENTPDLIVRWDRDLRRIFVNPAFARAIGTTPEKIMGTIFGTHYEAPAVVDEAIVRLAEEIHAVFATGEPRQLETTFTRVEGMRFSQVRLVPERNAKGEITTVLGVSRDITEIKQQERELRTLTEHSPDAILRFDREGRYLYANSAIERMTGVPASEFIGQPFGKLTERGPSVELYRDLRERIATVCATRTPFESEVTLPAENGDLVYNMRLIPEPDESGEVASALMIVRDVTERQHAIDALRASEQRFRQVTENIDEVFWLTNPEKTEMVYVSPAYERIWGRSRESLYANACTWLEAVHPGDRARVEEAMAAQATRGYDLEYRILREGGVRWIHDRAFPIRDAAGKIHRVAGVAEDVSVRRELETQLRHSQKMDAVGQLAGGIAHDFNNLLAVIQMQSSLLEKVNHPEIGDGIQEILLATDRAANLTRQLLTFSRRQVPQPTDLDITDSIGNVTKLLRRLLGENIALEHRFAPALPLVHVDAGMMEQVLMNLAINARDAMPEGGRLTVALDNVEVDEERAALHGAAAGRYLRLSVADTGCGIPAEILPRIFEPFFTTKDIGRGTGLGLATVFGIVEQHHGWIEVDSVVGRGTTFGVFLPAIARTRATARAAAASPDVRGGHETILLVEDEAAVRALTRTVLERYGYRVFEAETAIAASARWAEGELAVDLLLTDLVLPGGMSGHELALRLRARKPDLRVIYTSGYTADIIGPLVDPDGPLLLRKPYSAGELASTVRRCLDERR